MMTSISKTQSNLSLSSLSSLSSSMPTTLQFTRHIGHYWFHDDDDVIGAGAYGAVYRAYDDRKCPALLARTGPVCRAALEAAAVALKKMPMSNDEEGISTAALREIMTYKEVAHRLRADQRRDGVAYKGGYATYRRPSRGTLPSAVPLSTTCTQILFRSRDSGSEEDAEWSLPQVGNTSKLSRCKQDCSHQDNRLLVSRKAAGVDALVSAGWHHVLQMHESIVDPNDGAVYFAVELCNRGDLWHYLRALPGRCLTDPSLYKRWMREMVQGIAFLHSRSISHRDLKPQNVLLLTSTTGHTSSVDVECSDPNSYSVKVGDFGLVRLEGIPVRKYVHEAVTLWYRSPDVILGNTNIGCTADAWSTACVMVEVAIGRALLRSSTEAKQLRRIFTLLCGPAVAYFPSVTSFPHSATYETLLTDMAHAEEVACVDPDFAAACQHELGLMQAQRDHWPARHAPLAMQRHIAAIRARLRALLTSHGTAFSMLGEDGLDLLARLLMLDPTRRLTVTEALSHPFLYVPGNTDAAGAVAVEDIAKAEETGGSPLLSLIPNVSALCGSSGTCEENIPSTPMAMPTDAEGGVGDHGGGTSSAVIVNLEKHSATAASGLWRQPVVANTCAAQVNDSVMPVRAPRSPRHSQFPPNPRGSERCLGPIASSHDNNCTISTNTSGDFVSAFTTSTTAASHNSSDMMRTLVEKELSRLTATTKASSLYHHTAVKKADMHDEEEQQGESTSAPGESVSTPAEQSGDVQCSDLYI